MNNQLALTEQNITIEPKEKDDQHLSINLSADQRYLMCLACCFTLNAIKAESNRSKHTQNIWHAKI